jgi:hypothetical protein
MAFTRAWLARLVAASALAVVAGIHVHLAPRYGPVGEQVTQADLFRVQAGVAAVAALALLLRPGRLVQLVAAAVALASLLAVVLTVYVAIPAVGPFPRVFEPIWFGEKVVAAVAAAVALAAALADSVLTERRGPRRQSAGGRRAPSPTGPA